MPDAENTRKDRLEKTKDELVDELQDMERRLKKAEAEGARAEILKGSHRMTHDGNPDTRHLLGAVLDSNAKVVDMLTQAEKMIEDMGIASAAHLAAPVVVPLQTAGPERHRMPRR
tara:strand:- start:488 stop:832 length:345 start_codon:yes stop_codon:yes gene_type:complete